VPAGIGYEVSETIEQDWSGVSGFKVGEKVATFPAQNQGEYPAYGEWAITPAASVARYPVGLSDIEAASYWTPYPNVIYFNEVDKGGHFAAWEQPNRA